MLPTAGPYSVITVQRAGDHGAKRPQHTPMRLLGILLAPRRYFVLARIWVQARAALRPLCAERERVWRLDLAWAALCSLQGRASR